MGILRERLSKYIIDKTKEEWKRVYLNPSGVSVELPDSLHGEILLEEDIRDGKCYGWKTVHPDALEELFSDAIQEHLKTSRRLGEIMLEHDDIYVEVDPSKPDEEALRIIAQMREMPPPELLTEREKWEIKRSPEFRRIRNKIASSKHSMSGEVSKVKIKIGEKGYKKYIRKWIEEGLI